MIKEETQTKGVIKQIRSLKNGECFHRNQNVIFVQYHLDYSKKRRRIKKLSFACTQFLSRKVNATEVLGHRNVILNYQ